MTLSAAQAEAYASNDVRGDWLETLQIDHVTLAQPLLFIQGTRVKGVYETRELPVPGNPAAVFEVADFSWQRPSQEEGGTTKARLRVDNISRAVQEALRGATAADKPLIVTYRAYQTTDLNNPEVYDGLRMSTVSVTPLSASGDLGYEEIEMRGFPASTYDLERFPALFGQ